ncbi:hypothetical protein HPB52_004319 [Rhipicephalus sanguineus]|uniref:Uncharacterized protein n=1 Tax=Rhipicephalus sanguineus TaxID=34632 RepID=A0A9D4STQ1_RHISA|nr:hypothetical protein HPB52_004319 [Rhipicephalus sanguineus]
MICITRSPGARVAIAAIATDRERFVGGVHFRELSHTTAFLFCVDLLGAIQMVSGTWRDVKTNTVANCIRKAGFVMAELAETSDDGDDKCIDDISPAVPPEVSADDFEEADCNVQAVASLADEDIVAVVAGTQDAQADSSSGDEDRLEEAAATRAYSAAEVAAAFGSIRRFCGDME